MLLASLDRTELLRGGGGGGCVYAMKNGIKTELNHAGHQFYLVFSTYFSGFTLPIIYPDSLQPSHPCCQRHEVPLRKATACTFADVWIQTERD